MSVSECLTNDKRCEFLRKSFKNTFLATDFGPLALRPGTTVPLCPLLYATDDAKWQNEEKSLTRPERLRGCHVLATSFSYSFGIVGRVASPLPRSLVFPPIVC